MSYDYAIERPKLFTPEGVQMICKVRDTAKRLHRMAGAFSCTAVLQGLSGDSWTMLAVLDYLIENAELRLIAGEPRMAQHWLYEWIGQD